MLAETKAPKKTPKKDWGKFDSEMADQVEKIVAIILELRPLERVTYNKIGILIKYKDLSHVVSKGKLPKTKALLDKYTETTEEFAWRRLHHVINHFKSLGIYPSKNMLIKAANPGDFKNLPDFEEAIINATKASN